MKARIKSSGKIVEVVSRFMPKKRNVPSRDWVCNLSDGTCIDENQLEYIDAPEGLEEAAENYRRESYNAALKPHIDGPMPEYVGSIKAAFIAGGKWKEEQMMKKAVEGYVNYYEDSGGILMAEAQVGCPYHNGDKVRIIVLPKED